MRILYIDDNQDNITILIHALTNAFKKIGIQDVTIDSSEIASDGLAMLEDHSYDFVILDWVMPDIGGKELLEFMLGTYPDTPIAILTANINDEDLFEYTKKHNVQVFSKPLKSDIVAKHILEKSKK